MVRPDHPFFEADPEDVHRVLLLYSGGLDTSVMLKWIQEEYKAEVVALTVNLGQPGEDYEVIRGKALQIGAVDCHVVDAREQFAHEYVLPAIKANAIYGTGYPLFTALGRPLIAKLAVQHARDTGCDTIAHGCTGKGNDQVRIEATVMTLAPELKVIAPVRSWRMGREEEIAYAREHGIPVKGGTEAAPYSLVASSDNCSIDSGRLDCVDSNATGPVARAALANAITPTTAIVGAINGSTTWRNVCHHEKGRLTTPPMTAIAVNRSTSRHSAAASMPSVHRKSNASPPPSVSASSTTASTIVSTMPSRCLATV